MRATGAKLFPGISKALKNKIKLRLKHIKKRDAKDEEEFIKNL